MADVKNALRRLWRFAEAPRVFSQRHESLWVYRQWHYLKIAAALCLVLVLVYVFHDPIEGPSGSTWYGYATGTLGAGLIVWLSWFGVRKRRFRESRAPAQAWVSAHVYFGLALLLVATLHSGFQLGFNVHSLAYVLMVLVIVSGILGATMYRWVPRHITANREQREFRVMLEEIAQLNQTALIIADKIDAETHAVAARSVGAARIGGSAWEQLTGRYRKQGDPSKFDAFIADKRAQLASLRQSAPVVPSRPAARQGTIFFVADQIFSAQKESSGESLQKLLQVIAQRNAMLERVNRDITLRARLTAWLYLHVPLTVALLAALLVHVLCVFLYW